MRRLPTGLVARGRSALEMFAHEPDRRALLLVGWAAIALLLVEFLFIPLHARQPVRRLVSDWGGGDAGGTIPWWVDLAPYAWWSLGIVLLWVVVPAAIVGIARARAMVVPPTGMWSTLVTYAPLVAVMLPLVGLASRRPDFLATYPLLHATDEPYWSWAVLGLFWLLYALQLACTEFLFRGALLFALEARVGGALAIALATVPYALIHVHKPLPEALGAVVAGYALGYFALRTRAILGGIMVHVAVALTMDSLALARLQEFPTRWMP